MEELIEEVIARYRIKADNHEIEPDGDTTEAFNMMEDNGVETNQICHTEVRFRTRASDMFYFRKRELEVEALYRDKGYRVTKTIIITKEITENALAVAKNPKYYPYEPQIYNTNEHYARAAFDDARKAMREGGEINSIDLLLTPLYNDERKAVEVLNEACDLVLGSGRDKEWQEEIMGFLIMTGHKCMSSEDLNSVIRRVIRMGYSTGELFVRNTLKMRNREVATGLIKRGMEDYGFIAEISNLSLQQVMDIKASLFS
jgi:hypothetical protein